MARKTDEQQTRATARPYTLFKFDGHGYGRLGELTNRSGEAAAQEWIERNPDDKDLAFMAVPSRYVKLIRFTQQVKTTFKATTVAHEDVQPELPLEDTEG